CPIQMLVFLCLFVASAYTFPNYVDSTCFGLPSSREWLTEVDRAKMLGLGTHSCNIEVAVYNPSGSFLARFNYTSVTQNSYNALLGAVHSINSDSRGQVNVVDEYYDGRKNVCFLSNDTTFGSLYGESIDQNKGDVGQIWRSIGYYSRDSLRKLQAFQNTVPTTYGYLVTVMVLDSNQRPSLTVVQTCSTVGHSSE